MTGLKIQLYYKQYLFIEALATNLAKQARSKPFVTALTGISVRARVMERSRLNFSPKLEPRGLHRTSPTNTCLLANEHASASCTHIEHKNTSDIGVVSECTTGGDLQPGPWGDLQPGPGGDLQPGPG